MVFKKGTRVKIKNCTTFIRSYREHIGEVGVIVSCATLIEEIYGVRLSNGKIVGCLGCDLIRYF